MIKLTATALIHYISPVIDIPSRAGGNSFQKRELILNDSWIDRNNQEHPNFVLIEFSGEAMNALDSFQPGQRVIVDAYVNGREYNGRYFNTIRGQSIKPYQQPQAAVPTGYPQAPAYPQQPAYPQAAGYPQQAQSQQYNQQGNLGIDHLPFHTQ